MASLPRVRQLAAHPTLSEARAGRIPVPHVSDQTLLVWGPVSVEESQSVGASHPASSVVLQLCVPEELRRAVLAEVPADVLPRPDDDAKSLKERLTGSTFLEDSHVLKNGKGPSRVRLNGTCYPQPRRIRPGDHQRLWWPSSSLALARTLPPALEAPRIARCVAVVTGVFSSL